MNCTLYPPCNPPPPFATPPPPRGGTVTWPKENFYKAPKLISTVILWYSFVVQSHHDIGGEITRGGGGT